MPPWLPDGLARWPRCCVVEAEEAEEGERPGRKVVPVQSVLFVVRVLLRRGGEEAGGGGMFGDCCLGTVG